MITITVNGTPYTDFINASCTVSLETLANDFSFAASAVGGFPPFKYGDQIEIRVDDVVKVTGPITGISGTDAEGNHLVTYTGRDLTSDLIDSDIDNLGDISAEGLTLKRLIELVIAHIGSSLSVIDNFNPPVFNQAEDSIKPQVGDNCLEFLNTWAKKRQALLTSDGRGNVVITQAEPTDSGAVLQRLIDSGSNNNILSQSWFIEYDELFHSYRARGQQDPNALNFSGTATTEDVVSQSGEETDDAIPAGRQRVIVEASGYSNEQLANRAKWSRQLARARAVRYSCTVKGHSHNGGLWTENTLVLINSETADISRKMLVNTATFSQAESAPTITNLEFVERDVYTTDNKLLSQKKTGDEFDAFTL